METTVSASTRLSRRALLRRVLLICGVLSSLFYVGADIFAAMQWEGYSYTDQAFSELTAIGAPTRPLMVWVASIWGVLVIAFGLGVWGSAGRNRALHITGVLLVANVVAGSGGGIFFPMNLRGTGVTVSDTMHIVFTTAEVLFLVLSIGFGAAANGKWFRLYSIVTIVVLLLFGAWAGSDGSQIAAGLPTPWFGVKERINIYASMLWVLVFAITLLWAEKGQGSIKGNDA
jgi:hypothetical protein